MPLSFKTYTDQYISIEELINKNYGEDYLAVINNPEHSTVKDGKGELIFYAPTNYFKDSSNLLIKASVFWVLSEDDVKKLTLDQILCKKCNKIGFGIAQSNDTYYVVAKYNKMGEFK